MYRITAVMLSVAISVMSMAGTIGAAFVPYMPYVPPSDAIVWDLIYNVFGTTSLAAEIEDVTDRAAAYYNIYQSVLSNSNQALLQDVKEVIEGAKTKRKLTFTPQIVNTLQSAILKASTEGIVKSETPALDMPTYNEIIDYVGISQSYFRSSDYNRIISESNAKFGSGNWTLAIICAKWANTEYLVYMYTYPKNLTLKPSENSSYDGKNYTIALFPNGIKQATSNLCYVFDRQYYYGSKLNHNYIYLESNYPLQKWKNYGKTAEYARVSVQDTKISTGLQNNMDIPITANSVLENGVLDTTRNLEIDLPTELPQSATDPLDIPAVQEKLNTIPLPITEDVADTLQQIKEQALSKYGDAGDYALDLTRYFPFCLPFDVARVLQAFVAEPEAPSFSYTINNPFSEEPEEDIILEIDLAQFDDVAAILRTLESIFFVVGLAVVTRSLYLRG